MQHHFWAVIIPVGTVCTLRKDEEISLEEEPPHPPVPHGMGEEGVIVLANSYL